MTLRFEHVGVVVDDLEAAVAFFVELGLERSGDGWVGGDWVDRIVGLEGVRSRFAFVQTPDGRGELELIEFLSPRGPEADPPAANLPGLRHLCFAVDDLAATVDRLQAHGGELVGEIVRYEDRVLLCYVRGPGGAIIELADRIG